MPKTWQWQIALTSTRMQSKSAGVSNCISLCCGRCTSTVEAIPPCRVRCALWNSTVKRSGDTTLRRSGGDCLREKHLSRSETRKAGRTALASPSHQSPAICAQGCLQPSFSHGTCASQLPWSFITVAALHLSTEGKSLLLFR